MSLNVVNLPNGATDPTGQNRLLGKLFNQSGVIQSTAFTVGAPGGMFVSISGSLNNDDAVFIASDGSTYGGWNTANITTQAVASNGTGATRYDAVVLYVDTTAGNPSTITPNNPGALKILLVRSTNTSPTLTGDITASAVGTKPYIRLADVLVGAGVGSINAGNIADTRPRAAVKLTAGNAYGSSAKQVMNYIPRTITSNTWDFNNAGYLGGWGSNTSLQSIVGTTAVRAMIYIEYASTGAAYAAKINMAKSGLFTGATPNGFTIDARNTILFTQVSNQAITGIFNIDLDASQRIDIFMDNAAGTTNFRMNVIGWWEPIN